MTRLDALTLHDLTELRALLLALCEAGKVIDLHLPGVSFDLTPGRAVTIRTPFEMPAIIPVEHSGPETRIEILPSTLTAAEQIEIWRRGRMREAGVDPDLPPEAEAGPEPEDDPEPVVVIEVDDLVAEEAAPLPTPDSMAPVELPDLPEPEPEPEPEAEAHEDRGRQAWSDAEEERLVLMVAEAMAAGKSRHAAAAEAAGVLGRPVTAVRWRCANPLAARIEAALAGDAPPLPPEEPRPVLPEALHPVAAHLRGLAPFGRWTPDLDRDLLRLAEEARWRLHEICLELGVSSAQAQQRLSTLTKAQAFKRAEVWAAMQAIGYGEEAA